MENFSSNIDEYDNIIPSRSVQFWTILIFQIPSLACIIYLLYHLLLKKKLREALHNHVIIILLFMAFIVEIIDHPLYLDAYLHNGKNSFSSSPLICYIWIFVDYGIYGIITVFFTWASVERHILIFHHNQFLRTKLQRLIFHYFPLGIIFIYITGFYIGVLLFPPCKTIFDYNYEVCGMEPCYEEIPLLNVWDYMINGSMCTIIEAIASILLLFRVIWRKQRLHQQIHWKKYRKMAIQLLSISTLSLSITLPQALITAIQQMGPEMNEFGYDVEPYFFYLTTFVVLFLPIVLLGSFPELWPKFIWIKRRQKNAVVPFTMTANRQLTIFINPQRTLK